MNPIRVTTPPAPSTLELSMPVYHFHEVHRRRITADAAAVWTALVELRLDQLTVTRPLVALRGLGRGRAGQRLLSHGPITVYEMDDPHYVIGGAIARPWQARPAVHPVTSLAEFEDFDEPGWTKYLVDFRIEPDAEFDADGNGVVLSTETRGYSTDAQARWRFGAYWLLIRAGSAVIRHDVLASVSRIARAEQP